MAVLALAALAATAAAAPPEVSADSPLNVRFRLADGVRIAGEMTDWDDDGFEGSFGRRRWVDLAPDDAWDLRRRVMDRDAADHWIALGRLMLLMDNGANHADRKAEQAFRRAIHLDQTKGPAIAEARAAVAETKRLRVDEEKRQEAGLLRTSTPEAGPWSADPWPTLAEDEQKSAVLTMKADAGTIVRRAALEIDPVETDRFLVYSDLPRQETARWALRLEELCERLAAMLIGDEKHNVFWGKAVVFIFAEPDRFRLVEADAFGQLVPSWKVGMCHFTGPKVFVNIHHSQDEHLFEAALLREAVHGFMHRHQTTARLPAWANEGFADHVAAVMIEKSPVHENRRRSALEFVRGGGDVNAVLNLSYEHDSWLRPDSLGCSVGHLMIELMIRQRPRKYVNWVNAIKAGKDWQPALKEDYGVGRAQLVDTFTRYYRVND